MKQVFIPVSENDQIIYANIYKNLYSPGYSLVVKKCPFCKMEHIHSGEEGHRSAHCFNKKSGKSLPVIGYILKVDWNNHENRVLRGDYEAFFLQKTNEKRNI